MRHFIRLQRRSAVALSLLILFLLIFSYSSFAQTRKITGSVVDSKTNEPIVGATIYIKGIKVTPDTVINQSNLTFKAVKTGTSTDRMGKFSLTVPGSSVLIISSVGYETKEVSTDGSDVVTVQLENVNQQLGDVVVVGYGSQKKTSLAGAVITVTAKTFQDRGPIASPLAALQGQAAGVTVTRSSSQPGREGWNFQIRGASSTNATEPLVIVDGIPLPGLNALNSFNPADIESVSFLKDAAAAIYGSRAAGGVVLITTKRAKRGRPTIDYNGSVSIKRPGLMPTLIDGTGWGPIVEESRVADGFNTGDLWYRYAKLYQYAVANNVQIMTQPEAQAALTTLGLNPAGFFTDVKDFPFFPGTEQDVLWGNATSAEHQLSISSRGDNGGYRLSLGYLNDGSLLQPGNNSTGLGLTGKPYVWGSGIGNASVNTIADYGGDNKELNTRLNASFNLTYKMLKNLQLVGSAGYYLLNTDYKSQENIISWYNYDGTVNIANLPARSSYQRGNKKENNYSLSGYAEYSKSFAGVHDIKAMAGAQYERFEYDRIIAKTLDVPSGVPPSLSTSTGDPTTKTVAEAQFHTALAGYFSRLNYSYKNKYLFEGNARYDGSSKFVEDSRWKFFYGFLVGWRMTEEKFMENIKFINDLKLRASLGYSGNQSGIGNYDYIQFLNLSYSTGAGSTGFPILGASPVVRISPTGTLVALDRTWEKIKTTNIGIDFTLLNRRLSGSFDYFQKRNGNMLIARTFPAVLGASAPAGNNGDLKTWGWELSLNWSDRIGQVTYHIGGNVSDNQNKLVNFGGQTLISSGNRGYNFAVQGYPIGTYFGLVYNGRIQSQKDLDAYRLFIPGNTVGMPAGSTTSQANTRLALGDNIYKDLNGDGKITFPEDAIALGRDDPRYTYSFNGGIEWKGFDLGFIFQGVAERTIIRDGNWRIPTGTIFQAQNEAFYGQYWTATRTDARLPRISSTGTINNYNYFPSDWVTENGAYLRLKNLVIGYTVPRKITQKAKIERLRFYFSGNDLWEISKIKDGWDPEATRTVSNSGDGENNGVSTFSQRFPFYRYLTFGANLTF